MIRSIGAWCGAGAIANPNRDVDAAAEAGLDALYVMTNDHAPCRRSMPFRRPAKGKYPGDDKKYPPEKIVTLSEIARSAGLSLHLTSWIMPHERYMIEAVAYLVPLLRECQASSLIWDCEEPWILAKLLAMTHEEAAIFLVDLFNECEIPIGCTGIAYTNTDRYGPLAKRCNFGVPQAYATRSTYEKWGVTPAKIAKYLQRHYVRFSQDGLIDIHAGLASYRQGFGGMSVKQTLETSARTAHDWGAGTFIYWSLDAMRRSKTVRETIRGLRECLI